MRILRAISAFILLSPLVTIASSHRQSPQGAAEIGHATSKTHSEGEVEPLSTTVIDLLSTSSHHTILLHLLQRCKLVPSVNLMQGLTLFAPTDQAWERWAKGKQNGSAGAESKLVQMILEDSTESMEDLVADNILFDTRQLLLYHMLNYTLPLGKVNQFHENEQVALRWLANNVSTETTLLFPSRHHHPSGHLPPPHPPWFPQSGTGTLGGYGQQMRLFFDGEERAGPGRVQVDLDGQGGAGVWTGWTGNRTTSSRPAAGDKYRIGSNGIVIGIDQVLSPPVDLATQLDADPELSSFASLVSMTSLTIPFNSNESHPRSWNITRTKHTTVFAPSNAAFDKAFDELERRYLWSEWGMEARKRILGNHILLNASLAVHEDRKYGHLPSVGWRGSFFGKKPKEVITASNRSVTIQVDEQGQMLVNSTSVTSPDSFGANGVLHRTNKVILPPGFKLLNSPEKVMLSLNASRFVSLLRQAGLASNYTDTVGSKEKRTFLVPTDDVLDAIREWDQTGAAFDSDDGAKLEDTLKYHILPGRITPKHLKDGELLMTELDSGKLGGDRQRLRVHVESEKRIGEQGVPRDIRFGAASVTAEPYYADDYIIYLVSTLNSPPEDVIQTAVSNLDLSTFVASLFAAGLDKLVRKTAAVTYFAPTNQAFRNLGLISRYLLGTDGKDDLRKILKYNIVDGLVYAGDIQEGVTTLNTLIGEDILVNRTSIDANFTQSVIHGPIRNVSGLDIPVNGMPASKILDYDLLTATGPIHVVGGVQIPPRMNITHGKLLQGAGCSTLIDLLVRSKMDWLLAGQSPPTEPDNTAQERSGILRPSFTILAPSDQAFARINLTYYLNNEAALLSLLSLHIVTLGQGSNYDLATEVYKTRSSYPLLLRDESMFSTLHSVQRFGDVIFRNDGHGSWLVGINAARGIDQQNNAARVLEAGKASPVWLSTDGDQPSLFLDDVENIWRDGQSIGGGVITIDRVLLPYEPGWFADWGYLAGVLGAGGLILILMAGYVGVKWRRTSGKIRLEGEDEADIIERMPDREAPAERQ